MLKLMINDKYRINKQRRSRSRRSKRTFFKCLLFFFHKIKLFTDDDNKFLQYRLFFTLLECGTIYCILFLSIHEKQKLRGNRNETVLSFCGRR